MVILPAIAIFAWLNKVLLEMGRVLGILLCLGIWGVVQGQYCLPTYSVSCSSNDYIDRVVFGAISNINSGCNGSLPNNYTYFSNMSTTVQIGQTYTIELASGTAWSQHFGVWIDFNQDGDFQDPGEFVFNTTGAKPPAGSIVTGNITIPLWSSLGVTRMRVRCWYSSTPMTQADDCSSTSYGECEDYDIIILPPSDNDVGVSAILSPVSECEGGQKTVVVQVSNYGINTINGLDVDVHYRVNGGAIVTENLGAISIPAGTSVNYTFATPANLPTTGNYFIEAWTTMALDTIPEDDTAKANVTVYPVINTFPYLEDFNTSDGFWTPQGNNPSWQWGVPTGKFIKTSGPSDKCWITNLTGNANSGEDSWILSPCIDLSSLTNPIIKFDLWCETDMKQAGAVLQYSTDGGVTWQNVGKLHDPINWYNYANIAGQPGGSSVGWSGAWSRWINVQHRLDGLGGNPNVLLRIAYGSAYGSSFIPYEYEGVAIDNLVIMEEPWIQILNNDTTICVGDTISITAVTNLPNPNYAWSTGDTTQTIDIWLSGLYRVRAYGLLGVATPYDTLILETQQPFVNLPETKVICEGSNTPIIPDTIIPGNSSLLWSTGDTSAVIYVDTGGVYWLQATDPLGCTATDTIIVQSFPPPTVYFTQDTIRFCEGDQAFIEPVYSSDVDSLAWNTGDATPGILVTLPGTYTIVVYTREGCSDTASVVVDIYPRPAVTLGNDVYVCNGQQVTLDAGSFPGATYQWNTGDTTQQIIVQQGGNYWVTVTSPYGCSASDTVFVAYSPSFSVDLGPDTSSCGTVTLDAGFFPGFDYVWSTGQNTQTITVSQSGTYYVIVANPFGCRDTDTVTVTILDQLNANITTNLYGDTAFVGIPVQFIDQTVPIPSTWLWNFGDGSFSILQNPQHTYQQPGTYDVTLKVTKEGWCDDSASKTIIVLIPSAVEKALLKEPLRLYPNPTAATINLQAKFKKFYPWVTIEVLSLNGQKLWKQQWKNIQVLETQLDLRSLSKGMYLVRILTPEAYFVKPVLKY